MGYLFAPASSDRIDCGASVAHAATFSLFVRVKPTQAVDAEKRFVQFRQTSGSFLNNASLEFIAGATNRLAGTFSHSGTTSVPAIWTSGWTAGTIHTVVLTYDGTTLRLYADTDATPKATTADAHTPDQNVDQVFQIGGLLGFTDGADGVIYEVGWWPGTVLSGAEAAGMGAGTPPGTLPANYWPLISNALDFFGGQHGTVTGATVVAHSGTNLYTAYSLAAAVGAFTLTGQSAALSNGHPLAATVGAFTETGQAASLRAGHRVGAVVGAYTLTGQAATLRAPYKLAAAVGVFLVTGSAAALQRSQAGETVVLLGDGSGYPSAGHLTIGTEDIAYTGYTVAGGVTTFTGITRGARGTTVGTHPPGTLAHNGEQLRKGQRLTLFAGYAPLDEEDYGPGPGYVRMQIQAVNSPDNGMTWLISATDIQRFIQRSIFTNATSDNPSVIGPDHPITIALKILHSTGSGANGPYDVLPADQGAAVPQAFVATDLLEFIRDAIVPGFTMQFREIQATDAKGFVEGQCFRPLNLVPFITQRGRYSARLVRQPIFMRSGTVAFDAFRAA